MLRPVDGVNEEDPAVAETARSELRRMLATRRFRKRPTLSRLLRHLAESLIDGQTARLREGTIGVDVFGRDPRAFDPSSDAIVRVAATRLRRLLDDYYADEGRDATVVFVLRRGTYVPQFARRGGGLPAAHAPDEDPEPALAGEHECEMPAARPV